MSTLRGFPPSSTISPSVRIKETDQSFIAPRASLNRAGLVGFASKGPINTPTLIKNRRQLTSVFGNPHPDAGDPYMIYAAELFLLFSNELYIVRVADEDPVSNERATVASGNVPSAGGRIQIISATAENYVFAEDSFFRWRLNSVLSSKTLVVLAGTYTCTELAEELNSQLDVVTDGSGGIVTASEFDGIQFRCTDDNRILVETSFAFGSNSSLELVSVQNAIYGPGSVTGLGTGMTKAVTTGANESYGDGYQVPGTFDLTGLTGLNLKVVVSGTDNVLIDNVTQTIDLSNFENTSVEIDDIVNEIQDQIDNGVIPGGFTPSAISDNLRLTTDHSGRDARILVKSESTAFDIFGFSGITARGTSPEGVTGSGFIQTYGIVSGTPNITNEVTFELTAESAGIDGNMLQIVITNDISEGTFRLEIYTNGNQVESWGGLNKNPNSRFYVESFLALFSDYVRAIDNSTVLSPPANGTYSLSGGSDGVPSDPDEVDQLLAGRLETSVGLFALSEPEQIDIDIVAVPGHSSTLVVTELIRMCELRQDCLAIIDPPFGLTAKEVKDWQNGAHPLNAVRFDSSFAALYWPWVKIRDTFNRIEVWAPPSGAIMATFAISEQASAPWFAVAGTERGIVPEILDVFSRPSLEERDEMYGNRNAVNPIISFSNIEGFMIWGNKTLQRRPTALDRINVRRLMFAAEKRIRNAARSLQFEPNDEIFRDRFTTIASAILDEIRIGRGLLAYRIQADEELNPPDVIDRNEFRARIGIQPTRSAEFIYLDFSIHRTGSFAEASDAF